MDTQVCRQFEPLLTMLADGRMDQLTPEQMDSVAAHVDACPACEARLAGVSSQMPLPSGLAIEAPSTQQWSGVWAAIERAAVQPARAVAPGNLRWPVRRIVQAFTAAAACLLVGLAVWQYVGPSDAAPRLTLDLAHASDVAIESLEVAGDDTSFVVTAGAEDDIPIIWVFEKTGGA